MACINFSWTELNKQRYRILGGKNDANELRLMNILAVLENTLG